MNLFILEPGESMIWHFRLGRRGTLEAKVDASVAVSSYVFEEADFDEDADPDLLPYYARSRRKLSHHHSFNLSPGTPVVVLVVNRGEESAAVHAKVGTK